MALEEVYRSYRKQADCLGDWVAMNKNDLANAYIANENNPVKRDQYMSALMCRYWGNIGKYYVAGGGAVAIHECYNWLVEALTYALRKRKWKDPTNKLYSDPSGPDKVINRVLSSIRLGYYQSSNTDKRRSSFNTHSLDNACEEFGDAATFLNEAYCEETSTDKPAIDIIQYYINADMLAEAVTLDGICFGNTFKQNTSEFEFSERSLVRHLKCVDDAYLAYFKTKYDIDETKLLDVTKFFKGCSSNRLHTFVRKTIYKVAHDKRVREALCL